MTMFKVLIIDDDEKLVELVKEYLEPNGFDVHAVHTGPEGVSAVSVVNPEIIILDVMLPGMDGFDVCRAIRASSQVPIIMLTAKGEDTDRIVGLELGADDYLSKPFNPRELLARLKAILRRAGLRDATGEEAELLEVGPVTVDVATRSVTVAGTLVEFTTAEFDLLRVFMLSAGRVLSRDQLMEALHGTSWSYFDRSIDVHVSRIRQKIEDDPRHPVMLKTVRGVGYQLSRPRSGG